MEQTDPVAQLYQRAKDHGIPMASICRHAGVAETTPSRWNNDRNGPTFATLRKLHAALDDLIAPQAAA
jgi:hypothetical protein